MKLDIVSEEEILEGKSTDKYFLPTLKVLEEKNRDAHVTMEMIVKKFPEPNYKFGVVSGMKDIAYLLEGKDIDVYAMRDGDIFFPEEPILKIEGSYRDFGLYENPIIGFVSKASGIATKASRVRIAAKDKKILSFGTRRVHPPSAIMVERASMTGGFDGFSNISAEERLEKKAEGPTPHALPLIYSTGFGDCESSYKAYDEVMDGEEPRIMIVDTYGSPKEETFKALDVLKERLEGVRVDSLDRKKVGEELRWELDIRGRSDVKLIASGGLDEYKTEELADVYDGFGVGTRVADAKTLDLSLKVVEVDGVPRAKVGNYSGNKEVYRKDFFDVVKLKKSEVLEGYEPMLKPLIKNGKIVRDFENIGGIRERFLENLEKMPEYMKDLHEPYQKRVKFVGGD